MTELPAQKKFDTYIVASALSGIGLGPMSYSDIMDVASILFGASIFTHELAHEPTVDAYRQEGYRQFPKMPTEQEAQENFEAARAKAETEYGPFVTVKRGDHGRKEHPVDTLVNVGVPPEKIIGI